MREKVIASGGYMLTLHVPGCHAGTLNSGLPHLIDKLRFVLYGKHRRTFVDASYGAGALCLPVLCCLSRPCHVSPLWREPALSSGCMT